MTRKNRRLLIGAWLLCVVIIAALFLTGILNRPKIWTDIQLDYRDDQKAFSVSAGDEYGSVTNGPYFDLAQGKYRLKWQMEGDGENVIRLHSSNDVQIAPAEIPVLPGTWQGEAEFEVLGAAHNVAIQVEFCQGTKLDIYNFRLYTCEYSDHAFTAAIILVLMMIVLTMYAKGMLTQERRETLILLAVAVMIASLPALRENASSGWDTQFHSVRLRNIIDAFESGQFPARVGGFSYNGYGAVTSVFYPDVLLYPFALMLMLGASMAYVLNMLTVTCNALCALCMYPAAKRILGGRREALFAAILYVLSNFRIQRIYDSMMVGQMVSFAVLPIFIWGLWEVLFEQKRRWPVLVLGATLVFQSHMLTTLLCAGLAMLLVVVYFPRLFREGRLIPLGCAIGATAMINLFTMVPMITMYLGGATTTVVGFGITNFAMDLYQVLGAHGELGWALIAGMLAWLCASREELRAAKERHILAFVGVGVACLLISTKLFPWKYAVVVAGKILEMFQFTWRFLTLTIVSFALCAGLGYAQLTKGHGRAGLLIVLTLAVFCVMPRLSDEIENGEILEFGQDANPYMMNPEYQFEGTDLNLTRSRAVLSEGDVQITHYSKEGTKIHAQVDAGSDAKLSFPLFGYDGYAAALNGERMDWKRGDNNRLTIELPQGAQGLLEIWYEGKLIWKIADVISAASALLFAAYVWNRKKRKSA